MCPGIENQGRSAQLFPPSVSVSARQSCQKSKRYHFSGFLGPRGPLRTPLVSVPLLLSATKIHATSHYFFSFSFSSQATSPTVTVLYTVHRTLYRINSLTFLAQFGFVLCTFPYGVNSWVHCASLAMRNTLLSFYFDLFTGGYIQCPHNWTPR